MEKLLKKGDVITLKHQRFTREVIHVFNQEYPNNSEKVRCYLLRYYTKHGIPAFEVINENTLSYIGYILKSH